MRVIQVTSGGQRNELDVSGSDSRQLSTLQDAVGGWVEQLVLDSDLVILLDEDGQRKGLSYNAVATSFAARFGFRGELLGDVVVAGGPDESLSGWTSVPEHHAAELYRLV